MKLQETLDKSQATELYRQMLLIRVFEERAAEQYTLGRIRGFLHLYIGEEAMAVGAISTLEPRDFVVTHYRDHGHALARGLEPKGVMAELFGKATGCSGGKGGSMHLFDVERGFMGGYAIVGGQIPLAVGLALASKYKVEERVVVCFLGDGAVNEGEFHESMNLAALWEMPVIFFCENNRYGMGAPVEQTLVFHEEIYKMARAYHMPAERVDGMDVLAVRELTREAVGRVRGGGGPFFIEALAYRFRGHSMADPMLYRARSEEEEWRKRDPIPTFRKWLLDGGLASQVEVDTMERETERRVEEAIQFADESPFPGPEALFQDVYGE
ncbi:MAG: pyruvate dehydrogenase (acetyl-transferring) component, alpha subunit [Dehalococcoidia bacterium]|nr:pyruvate dehydrogenase (acetyl-transferring) component, alpha subunit [Dehalococcoidia bacterium]